MDPVMFLELAAQLRTRATAAGTHERTELLYLATEYEALAAKCAEADGPGLSIVIPN